MHWNSILGCRVGCTISTQDKNQVYVFTIFVKFLHDAYKILCTQMYVIMFPKYWKLI